MRNAVATLLLFGASSLAAQTATVTGRVTDAKTGAPIAGAQVSVTGAQLGAAVDAEGRYRITGVPISAREVRARRIGYQSMATAITLTGGGTVTADFALNESTMSLDAMVITGSAGDTRKRAIGNAVATVSVPDATDKASLANVMDVLQAKTPGLMLIPGSGSVGVAPNLRLRGAGSLYAGNNPVIYVDGVRISQRNQGNYDVFGQSASSLEAINPNDIESIEVIKGPAAATLYGAEAAAGVMQIITKQGRNGVTRWDARYEMGQSQWAEELRPVNYAIATAARLADTVTWVGFKGKALNDIISHRVLDDPGALRLGGLQKLSISASGGGPRYTFFVSGDRDQEDGVHLNNFSRRQTFRGNFAFTPTDKLRFSTSMTYAKNHIKLPLSDNNAQGLIISSYLAIPGRTYPFPGGINYSTINPENANVYDNQTRADRFILGGNVEYKPFSWFTHKAQVGLDINAGRAELYFAPNTIYAARASRDLDNSKGFLGQGRPLSQDVTFNYDASARHEFSSQLISTTSAGAQYTGTVFRRTDAFGQDLGSAGVKSISSAAVTSGTQSFSEQKSLGLYAQEQIAWRDRLFLTGAVRVDNNSAFGSELNTVAYPKLSLSWVISEEPFFKLPMTDEMRLRLAWGQAGNSPGPFDALKTYTVSVATGATTTSSALRYGSSGNPNLKPERGSEIELGVETSLWHGLANLDLTYYSKTTKDALLPVSIPPSTGFSGTRLENLGEISNSGLEASIAVTPFERSWMTVETNLTIATNKNRLVSFGDDRAPIIFGTYAPTQRYQEGYALGALWSQQVQRNADGTIVKVAGRPVLDTASVYMGPSVPTREVGFSSTVRLFKRWRLYGLVDYKGGHWMFNVKDWRRDRALVSWETVDPKANADEVLVRAFASQTWYHVQHADFTKLRDVSITYDIPESLLKRAGIQRASVTAAGHNLKIWTSYGGADPEINFNGGEATFNRNDSWTVPMTRRFSFALSVTY
jgi:TonB-linked SusC/RagA family outer membrane protein